MSELKRKSIREREVTPSLMHGLTSVISLNNIEIDHGSLNTMRAIYIRIHKLPRCNSPKSMISLHYYCNDLETPEDAKRRKLDCEKSPEPRQR